MLTWIDWDLIKVSSCMDWNHRLASPTRHELDLTFKTSWKKFGLHFQVVPSDFTKIYSNFSFLFSGLLCIAVFPKSHLRKNSWIAVQISPPNTIISQWQCPINIFIILSFQVTMSIDTGGRSVVSPGDLVTVRGKASPGSFMAFRAVDKSVLLMKEDTDITVQKVRNLNNNNFLFA